MNILICCNPNAGKGKARLYAERLAAHLKGHNVTIFSSNTLEEMRSFWPDQRGNPKGFHTVILIGGDGTIGPCVDAMIRNNMLGTGAAMPAIYAFGRGTANDFAGYFKTNKSIKRCARYITANRVIEVDTLKVYCGESTVPTYGVNNAAGGAFTNGVTTYSKKGKKRFGKFAYLFKAARQIFSLPGQEMRFLVDNGDGTESKDFMEKVFLFYILNTKNVGSLKGCGNLANPSDGMLDLVCLKHCGLWGKFGIFMSKTFRGISKSKNIKYVQGKRFRVETAGENIIHNFTATDIDGNAGGAYPMTVTLGPKIKVVVPKKYKV